MVAHLDHKRVKLVGQDRRSKFKVTW